MSTAQSANPTPVPSAFLTRVVSYPVVKHGYETAVQYYTAAKEKNALIKKSLELAETSIIHVASLPLVQNVSKSCEPILLQADKFGCSQLDKAEDKLFKPAVQLYTNANAAVVSSKRAIEEKVQHVNEVRQHIRQRAGEIIENTREQITSIPAVLTQKVLDFAEDSVDYCLPESDDEEDDSLEHAVARATKQPTTKQPILKWAAVRCVKLGRRAYVRSAYRVRAARLYGENILTRYPLAVSTLNYVRTRDPAVRAQLVEQFKTTAKFYTDKTKGFIAERTAFVGKATTFVQSQLSQFSLQSFYATLLTLLSTLYARNTTTSPSSSSSSSSSSPKKAVPHQEERGTEAHTTGDTSDDDTSGPAEPDHAETSDEETKDAKDQPGKHGAVSKWKHDLRCGEDAEHESPALH